MLYEIQLKSSAQKQLKKIDKKWSEKVYASIARLAEDPYPAQCKKLVGSPYYRIRIADYRVVYMVDDGVLVVLVLLIAHGREVYRNL
jgi:mRNA interferase RelE/StbE